MAPIHLRPTADLAERVLLPGDPGRALLLAQLLLDAPRMFNHHRGLWGYSGAAADGRQLTVQSTGMGGPSAAIVISELIELGARRLVRVGTCGALGGLRLGQLVVAAQAVCADGTSRALSGQDAVDASPQLVAALEAAAAEEDVGAIRGRVVSTDLFYDPREPEAAWRAAGLLAVEMEAATLFALGQRHGVETAALLAVSDELYPARERISAEALREAEERLGRVAAGALRRAE